jgi:hypothetical protein
MTKTPHVEEAQSFFVACIWELLKEMFFSPPTLGSEREKFTTSVEDPPTQKKMGWI